MLAVILASGDPERLYVALSLLVSTAVEGEGACGLVTGGIDVSVADQDLLAAARETGVRLYACEGDAFERSSIPRFLKATKAARLVVV